MRLSLGEVAAMLGTSCATPERVAEGYSIDSRTISRGQVFFAIRGPRFDGHEFVQQAIERGAVAAVVEAAFRGRAGEISAERLLPVPDTTRALQELARGVRRKWDRRLIAVTGSAGKTTTKELTAALLAMRFPVHKSWENLNNAYGLPLALLGLEPSHDVAVVELAMSSPGEIAQLARLAAPQIGVVTNVAAAHLQFFDSVDSIARAKRELIENLEPPATAVLNYDDRRVRRFAEGFVGRVVTFGFEQGADLRATDWRTTPDGGSDFRVTGRALRAEFHLPLPGRHNVENALAAIAASTLFDIPASRLREALIGFRNLHQRDEIITRPGPVTLINDTYNSNPLAMERLLETLAAWPVARRRILVAGEMLELGRESPELHREVGRKAARSGVDWLLAIQGDARFILEGAAEAGFPADRGLFFSTAAEAGKYCRELLQPGDVVLLKGSRAVHVETAVELLDTWSPKSTASPASRRGPS